MSALLAVCVGVVAISACASDTDRAIKLAREACESSVPHDPSQRELDDADYAWQVEIDKWDNAATLAARASAYDSQWHYLELAFLDQKAYASAMRNDPSRTDIDKFMTSLDAISVNCRKVTDAWN